MNSLRTDDEKHRQSETDEPASKSGPIPLTRPVDRFSSLKSSPTSPASAKASRPQSERDRFVSFIWIGTILRSSVTFGWSRRGLSEPIGVIVPWWLCNVPYLRSICREERRLRKWRNMIGVGGTDWKLYVRRKPQVVKRRVRKGIPDCLRGLAWQLISGSRDLLLMNQGVYEVFYVTLALIVDSFPLRNVSTNA